MFSHMLVLNHIGVWIVHQPSVLDDWTHNQLSVLYAQPDCGTHESTQNVQFAPVIQEFQQLIESDPEIFMCFNKMFNEVRRPKDDLDHVKDYKELMGVLNQILDQAPQFGGVNNLVMGVPIYAVLAPFCNTPSGYTAFTNPKVNAHFHKFFDVWTRFLVSPASRYVLTTGQKCWFSHEALDIMAQRLGSSFYDTWICRDDDPEKHYGFTSWDDFFTRQFRPGMRDVVAPENPNLITSACEASVHVIQPNVQALDTFWIKGHSYSLSHMFNHDPLTPQFVGGTVYQGILSSLDYHRWHSPVDGVVKKAYLIPGTYYAARLDSDPDPDVVSRSQDFVTAVATRALIFIESDNPAIGLMCFVAVGLGEVSTCEITVKVGARLKKGDHMGAFHFGGSTHCLVFCPQTHLRVFPHVVPGALQKVNSNILYIEN
ncbi:Phophatidylserine decarboxylase-domain-containing protein [Scleroderma citrinum]